MKKTLSFILVAALLLNGAAVYGERGANRR